MEQIMEGWVSECGGYCRHRHPDRHLCLMGVELRGVVIGATDQPGGWHPEVFTKPVNRCLQYVGDLWNPSETL